MQFTVLTLAALLAAGGGSNNTRYDIAPDATAFPQNTPKETLGSVLKAAEAKRFDYLAAQLADPAFIDDRVRRLYGGHFAEQVDDTRTRLDAPTLSLLRRFLKEGNWHVDKDTAVVSLKDVTDRTITFRPLNGRWFMEHRSK